MHTTIRLQGEPIIILSEEITDKLAKQMQALVKRKNLEHMDSLNSFLYAFWEYSILVPGEGYPFDVADFFQNSPDELAELIDLIPQAIEEIQKTESIAELSVIMNLREQLISYLEKLRT